MCPEGETRRLANGGPLVAPPWPAAGHAGHCQNNRRARIRLRAETWARLIRGPARSNCPKCRGLSAEGIVPGNLATGRRTSTKTGPCVGPGRRTHHHDGRVRLGCKKNGQIPSIGRCSGQPERRQRHAAGLWPYGAVRRLLWSILLSSSYGECRLKPDPS
jgi:hypothetical protein